MWVRIWSQINEWRLQRVSSLSSTAQLALMSLDDKQHRKRVVGQTVNNTQAESPITECIRVGSTDSRARITAEQSRSASVEQGRNTCGLQQTAIQECTITAGLDTRRAVVVENISTFTDKHMK